MNDISSTPSKPQAIYLKDYTSPSYKVESIDLRFELDEQTTTVTSRLSLRANGAAATLRPLRLDGQDLMLVSIALDGRPLASDDYCLEAEALILHAPPQRFELEIVTRINPGANTALEGLYVSGGNFCTQCEAEGFRRITYFPDRPDVMTVYTTTLVAEKRFPVLLSNGDCIERGELEDGRHFATWRDPFPKPAYLFALVAGDLARVSDRFITMSGREVALDLYVQHGNEGKCEHALHSLKKAMRWDEENYGREYDLDTYMIVAVDDFNMGAMENKGLNIFNSKFVLARPDTATDSDYVNIEGVIAHEYFHNWSGNRVTCRDWFQLSLKEGFTVFRDQQFTADMTSPAVKRIADVQLLRAHQFPEDAGPMAHPVRPDSYVEINNFYTLTVYEKGAEVVRMLHTLLGAEDFRRGSDLYFQRHDGQAVTTDDFVSAMEDANGVDLTRFRRWYSQAGTPEITVERHYDADAQRYTLTVRQQTPPTPGQQVKEPLQIPIAAGLLDSEGKDIPLTLKGESGGAAGGRQRVLALTEAEQRFTFEGVSAEPVPSLLRGFSAPVKLKVDYSDQELAFLMGHDSDPFNRWEAGQQLALRVMLRLIEQGCEMRLDSGLSDAFGRTLADERLDPALVAEALGLPDEAYVAEFMDVVDPVAIHRVREGLRRGLAEAHRETLSGVYEANVESGEFRLDAEAMGRRALKNRCLALLMQLPDGSFTDHCLVQLHRGGNMTDVIAALTALAHRAGPHREVALEEFYQQWRHDPLVLDKWFAIRATAPLPEALAEVQALMQLPEFSLKNPNRVRSLVGTFCKRNPAQFHRPDGAGYAFLGDILVALDPLNPQVAARLAEPLTHLRRFDPDRQGRMRAEFERLLVRPGLSRDLYEIASKSLG